MTPCLLALDTSTECLAVAVQGRERHWCSNEAGGALASRHLVPLIEALMAEAGLVYTDLAAIAFGCGPGAFTGLRTSCAVAQGLALGSNLPLIAIDSLLIVAEDARAQVQQAAGPNAPLDVNVAVDARMDEVYGARYRWHAQAWHTLDAPALYSLHALVDAWQGSMPDVLAGSASRAFGARLVLAAARRIEQESDRAAALLRLAQQGWRTSAARDAALALPRYVRDRVALTTQERTQERERVRQAKLAALP